MKTRAIRHVEWRIEQASELRSHFPRGQALCSKEFEAACLEGLQFQFYPSGHSKATEGYCSFFLYAPAGAALKFALQADPQRREVSQELADEPGCAGRTNFCLFDSCVDKDTDSVLLILDIDDAHQ